MNRKIDVTQKDIDNARKHLTNCGYNFENPAESDCSATSELSCNCPVAKAICRTLHIGKDRVCVFDDEIAIDVGNMYWGGEAAMRLPKKVKRFIDTFDAGKDVKPFSFTLKY